MSYGLYAENASGFIQIDENYENLLVIETGTKAADQNVLTVSSSITDDFIVFVRPNNPDTNAPYTIACSNDDEDERVFSITCWRGNSLFPFYKRAYDYAICVKASEFAEPTSGYGINVYKPDGNIRWSSEYSQFRLQAARFHEATETYYGAASEWYTSLDENIWCLGGAYGRIVYRGYTEAGEDYLQYISLRAKFDYSQSAFSTTYQTVTSDISILGTPFESIALGNKVELLGYIT